VTGLIDKANKDVQDKLQANLNPNGGAIAIDGDEWQKQTDAVYAKATKSAVELLTREQKTAWKDLVGSPVSFPLPQSSSFAVDLGPGGVRIMPAPFPAVPAPLPNAVPGAVPPPATAPDDGSGVVPNVPR
jgi:hypothetical protein